MKAKKKFGQNFLIDPFFINQIMKEINPKDSDKILEIGPGRGAITHPILQKIKHISVIEIDPDMIKILEKKFDNKKITILANDILKIDLNYFSKFNKIIGNLPYYIATEIIIRITKNYTSEAELYFMVQKEVADRISAKPSTKPYGRLSVILQYYFDAELLFELPAKAFAPAPKVTSAFIRLIRKKRIGLKIMNENNFELIIKMAFAKKRKTIRNNFKNILSDDDFSKIKLSPSIRAETLTIEQFINLENYLTQKNINFDN